MQQKWVFNKKNKKLIKKSFKEIQNRKLPKLFLNECSYYKITKNDRRFIFDQIAIVREEMEMRMPFLDIDLLDFYLTLPPRLRSNSYLISKTFNSLLPELAKIHLQSTMAPVDANETQKNPST